MKLIEWELLKPRNIVTIGVIILLWHVMLAPVFMAIGKVGSDADNA